jgi:hypothetical protein
MSELEAVTGPMGLNIERDRYFPVGTATLNDVMSGKVSSKTAADDYWTTEDLGEDEEAGTHFYSIKGKGGEDHRVIHDGNDYGTNASGHEEHYKTEDELMKALPKKAARIRPTASMLAARPRKRRL